MVELEHLLDEPTSLAKFRAAAPNGPWSLLGPEQKLELRHQLNLEQEGLCIYCEEKLNRDSGHIEHIKSKTLNPPLTFIYKNLAHSCNSESRCGHFKKREILPIEPRVGANQSIVLSEITGTLNPKFNAEYLEAQKVRDTVAKLGLDSKALNRKRLEWIATVRGLQKDLSLQEIQAFLSQASHREDEKRLA